jgi:hypothetical protein
MGENQDSEGDEGADGEPGARRGRFHGNGVSIWGAKWSGGVVTTYRDTLICNFVRNFLQQRIDFRVSIWYKLSLHFQNLKPMSFERVIKTIPTGTPAGHEQLLRPMPGYAAVCLWGRSRFDFSNDENQEAGRIT